MSPLFSLKPFFDHAFLLAAAIRAFELTPFKAIVTTVILGLAVAQALEQALLYRWIRVRNLNRPLVVRLHRIGGATAMLLVLVVLGSCLYTWLGLGYPPSTPRVVAHAVLGGLATVVLLTKVAIANWFRQYLGWTLPVGISAGVALLGVFLLAALPYFLGWL
jgi:hypothetical protein